MLSPYWGIFISSHPLPMLARGTSQKMRKEGKSWKIGRGLLGNSGCDTAVTLMKSHQPWLPAQDQAGRNSHTDGVRTSRPHPPSTEELSGKGEACFFVGMKSGKFLNILVNVLTSMHIQAAIIGLLTYKKKKKTQKKGEKS